jgi:uncharacterized phage-associated protein
MEISYLIGFDSRKAAQIAAYFLSKQPSMEKLKLIKLVYLAEREFVGRYGHPMIYDELYSLPHGPICSNALNAINGEVDQDYWSQFLKLENNNRNVHLATEIDRDILDEVSDAEIQVLETVWARFGGYTAGQIRQWTHKNCPEYTEVQRGRLPIAYSDMAESTGRGDGKRIEDAIAQARRVSSLYSH